MSDRSSPRPRSHVGHHAPIWHWFGLTINTDTVIATALAGVIVIALAFFRGQGPPRPVSPARCSCSGTITIQMRDQIERDRHEDRPVRAAAGGHAVRLHPHRQLDLRCCRCSTPTPQAPPASCSNRRHSDINFVLALAMFVFLCYHLAGIWRRAHRPPARLLGATAILAPSTSSKRSPKPISLSLRLFGNIFAGGIMVR